MDKRMHNWTPVPAQGSACALPDNGYCPTCADEALPAAVLCVDHENGWALVQAADGTREIDITLVTAVLPGDTLLVHGGAAISRL